MKGYHFHKEYEVILFLSEGASISIGNREYQVERGDLFFINESEYHKTAGAEGREYSRFVLMFDPQIIKQAEMAFNCSFTNCFDNHRNDFIHKLHLSGERLEEIILLFKRIEDSCHEHDPEFGQVKVTLRILELLLYTSRMYGFFVQAASAQKGGVTEDEGGAVGSKERINRIKTYVEEHIEEKLEQEQIADHFFISRHYLSHYFKKETGFTLGQYITTRKIEKAKDLLRRGFSVTETAVALSYYSDSHFINIFKRMTGTTPKRYAAERQT